MPWTRRHLITIEELSLAEIEQVHATAGAFKKILGRSVKKVPALRGKTIVNLFLEPSTRTRMAFDMAAKRLSADVIPFDSASSSTTKGETLRDTAENIQALQADMIVIRHSAAGSPLYLSRILDIPVINAGDGAHEHPTQGLLDTFTMKEHLGSLKGRKVVILGDVLFSRVARSNIHALTKLGANVTLVGPSTLVPEWFTSLGVKVSHDLKSALAMPTWSCSCASSTSGRSAVISLRSASTPACSVSTRRAPNGSIRKPSSCIRAPSTAASRSTANSRTASIA